MAVVGSEVVKEIVVPVAVVLVVAGVAVKAGAVRSETVRVKEVARPEPAEGLACTVTVLGPSGVEGWVVRVSVVEQLGLHDVGEKLAVTPDGRPEAEKVREAGVPFTRVAVIVVWVELPCEIERLPELEREKSKVGGGVVGLPYSKAPISGAEPSQGRWTPAPSVQVHDLSRVMELAVMETTFARSAEPNSAAAF